jgi:hypothetical protein
MDPQDKYSLGDERTEERPAQEQMVAARESSPELPAEQVYAQRLAEGLFNGDVPGPIFVP